ncbi:MAG: hypothetical protein JWO36_5423 [Myxococcales bacterium]|nr:hypothetical protein [Myxococcales bacterium]
MRTLALVSALLLALGCKGKPKHQDPPANAEKPGSGVASPKPIPDLVLPAGPGTPPLKTTKPLGPETFTKLAELKYPGFLPQQTLKSDTGFEMRQKTEDHPVLWATITIKPCDACLPMELPKWEDKKDSLKVLLMPELKDRPETEFTVGQTDLHGQPMIWTHQLGYYMGPEGGAFTNAYVLYYNDGVNQVRVVAEYKDDPASKENMLKLAPKQDLENVAKAFMDVYTHAWL